MLQLIEALGVQTVPSGKYRKHYGIYRCSDCFQGFKAKTGDVKQGKIKRCPRCKGGGKTHGDSSTQLYKVWNNMRKRIYNPSNPNYPNYGGRGIKICKEWETYPPFKAWALSNGYSPSLSIDRVDNDGNYTPANCRWADKTTQARNTRILRKNNTSGYRGVTFFTRDRAWKAQITVGNLHINIGLYSSKVEAAKAYNKYIMENSLKDYPLNKIQEGL